MKAILSIVFLLVSFISVAKDLNIDSQLLSAIRANDISEFERLLKTGAEPNFRDKNGDPRYRPVVMEQAAVHINPKFLSLALKFGANPNILDGYKNSTVLFEAAKHSKLENVKLLVKHGADINFQNNSGKTALHVAVAVKNYDIACYLLSFGANTDLENKWGSTAIDLFNQFGEFGVKKGTKYYDWYLEFAKMVAENDA